MDYKVFMRRNKAQKHETKRKNVTKNIRKIEKRKKIKIIYYCVEKI
jgi:hypothetical protein